MVSETHCDLKKHAGRPDPLALRIVRQIADVVSPYHVVLFGSRARGDWKPHSDIDLVIIGTGEGRDPQQANRARLTARKLASETYGKSIGVDVMYATPGALASFRGSLNNVLGHITREGVTMDGSPYDPNPAMPDGDADWLDIINRLGDAFRHVRHLDMEVAEPFSLSRDKYLSHTAQQALEHCCKALLTALGATYPRTHELADLFDLVHAQDPTIPLPRQHLWLSEFAGGGFYASLETPIAEPHELVADIHQACEMMISHILQLTGRDWNDLRGIYNPRPQVL